MTIKNQMDFFSLFEEVSDNKEEVVVEASVKKENKLDLQKKVEKPKEQNEKDKFEVNQATMISYLGKEISILEYFTPEEIIEGVKKKKKGEEITEPISSEEVRKRLEKDFPVLVKSYTNIVYIKKKNLLTPVQIAKTKGLHPADLSCFTTIKEKGKIPFKILHDFMSVAKKISDRYRTEVHADVYYDYENEAYLLDFPSQTCSIYRVTVKESPNDLIERLGVNIVKVMEIHSHHVLGPKPSFLDDQNEKKPIIFAIVGCINDFFPSLTIRTFDLESGLYLSLDLSDVFEPMLVRPSKDYELNRIEAINHEQKN
ncbi:hypothetical protein [Bacillus altitudinis]|uniref:hypothetical protein n=1 Tax=Bacillus altitudinis TaxID=293387 RepID=UPI002F92AED4